MRRGKYHQVGAGSRSRAQARAEDTARRSRKRAANREAMSDAELVALWDSAYGVEGLMGQLAREAREREEGRR